MSEIIDVTDTSRLVIEPDTDTECPRGDWHMLTGFVKIDGRGDSRLNDVPAVHDDPIGISAAHNQFWFYNDAALSRTEAETLTERWARIFHGLHIEYDSEHGGYWFVAGANAATAATPVDTYSRALFYDNWPDLKIGTPEHLAKQAEVIAGEQETYRQWAEGEVFGVILERKRHFTKIYDDGSGAEGDEWDEVDSIWGCYLDRNYTAIDVALEHFDLCPEEEEAAKELNATVKPMLA